MKPTAVGTCGRIRRIVRKRSWKRWHYHLNPLNVQETKEYINFRLARAGGSGIFTESAQDKLFEYTQGVPRRLNAWCDLALVAGFAEGRQEIDGEFIDTVIAAQGGSLEGPEETDTLTREQSAHLPEAKRSGISIPDNGLRSLVDELGARLTRLEGMVLEMTSQLVPVLTKFLEKPPLDSMQPAADINMRPSYEPFEKPDPDDQPQSRKRWLSRLIKT